MDYKSKVFFWLFFLLISGSVTATYLKYFVALDYDITAQADCDPASEKCFVHTCDPDVDGECPIDDARQVSYYKNVRKKANLIPLCDPNDQQCRALDCVKGMDCEVTYCDDSIVPVGDTCNDPVQYLKDRQDSESQAVGAGDSDEEETVCDGDTSCPERTEGSAASEFGTSIDAANPGNSAGS